MHPPQYILISWWCVEVLICDTSQAHVLSIKLSANYLLKFSVVRKFCWLSMRFFYIKISLRIHIQKQVNVGMY